MILEKDTTTTDGQCERPFGFASAPGRHPFRQESEIGFPFGPDGPIVCQRSFGHVGESISFCKNPWTPVEIIGISPAACGLAEISTGQLR